MKKRIIPRPKHPISRHEISDAALKVLYKLKKNGFQAYLVGGSIRDRLLGFAPKDFDISTNARPEQICKLFRNGILIGRRFKIVHIRYGREIIEVTTFRKANYAQELVAEEFEHQDADYLEDLNILEPDSKAQVLKFEQDQSFSSDTNKKPLLKSADNLSTSSASAEVVKKNLINKTLIADNSYGSSLEEDAQRRDFSINALYYNIKDFSIYDFFNGIDDLKKGVIRIIGDAKERYTEDPVRMLRALRFAAKFDFTLAKDTKKQIKPAANLILQVAPARMFDEVLKLFLKGSALKTLDLTLEFGLFEKMFPLTFEALKADKILENFLRLGFENTDKRIADKMTVIPAFLYGVVLWLPVKQKFDAYVKDGKPPSLAMQQASTEVLFEQNKIVRIPKRFSITTKEIWNMQWRLTRRINKSSKKVLESPRFKAGYDFLLLRQASGEANLEKFIDFWQKNLKN